MMQNTAFRSLNTMRRQQNAFATIVGRSFSSTTFKLVSLRIKFNGQRSMLIRLRMSALNDILITLTISRSLISTCDVISPINQ